MTTAGARALLTGLVDYAGLFPPTGLGMEDAVAEYARQHGEPEAWMLGRFVIPAARFDELAVMVDTFRPLLVSREALPLEDEGYARSWLGSGEADR